MRIALVGASGFIGLRTVEMFHLGGVAEVRAVVRSSASLAVLARMSLDWRVCDLLDRKELGEALQGCTVCVHAAIGDSSQIARMAAAAYDACVRARVPRMIWLSTASVHGQRPSIGTDETSPLCANQSFAYNNAKVRAEWTLDRLASDGRVEVVKVRPSIVYGPRSRWIANAALALLNSCAGWIDSGQGICNAIYVDNLVEAIRLSIFTSAAQGEAFLVGDHETVRWREMLLRIAEGLGFSEAAFMECSVRELVSEKETCLTSISMSPLYRKVSRLIPNSPKKLVKALNAAWSEKLPVLSPWALRETSCPDITIEMSELQQCKWKLPNAKAERLLDFRSPIPCDEGLSRSIAWLRFAGFPVGQATNTL